MAENVRPPVAVRIVRPYPSEDEFLENELETVGKTSVILIGAHPRPTGVILRFEVTLSSGATVLRGEGRVLSHKENAFRGQPGLSLRFTRLDPKSKALVDRAAAIREARIGGESGGAARGSSPSVKPPAPPPSDRSDPALAAALAATPVPPPPEQKPLPLRPPTPPAPPAILDAKLAAIPRAPNAGVASKQKTLELTPPPPPAPLPVSPRRPLDIEVKPPTPAPAPLAAILSPLPVPPRSDQGSADRDALLGRLRARASSLSPERVAEIMSLRRS